MRTEMRREAQDSVAEHLQSKIANTSRGPIEYVTWGEGPVVLALHGAMGGYDQGVILARTIGEPGYRYVSVSRPGYLGTPLGSGPTPEQQADLCAELLDALSVADVAVMAVSGGGPCALHFAVRHSHRCRALILVSTCSQKIDGSVPLAFRIMKLLAHWPALVNMMRRKRLSDPEKAARRAIPDPALRERTLQNPESWGLFMELMKSTFDRMPLRLPGTENDIRVTRATATYPLEKIIAPALIIHGTADRVVPFTHAKLFEARIPRAELLAIDGGEHISVFTHRNEIRPRVAKFLRESSARAAASPV